MAETHKQALGRLGEDLACNFLEKNGYRIVRRNVHLSKNELDIIAEDDDYIVFVEVKTRSCSKISDLNYGSPAMSVTYSKQKRTLLAAQAYLNVHPTKKTPRLDVIEVYLDKNDNSIININHIEDAFGN